MASLRSVRFWDGLFAGVLRWAAVEEILNALPPSARVLDIGSRQGSFRRNQYAFRTVCLDLEASVPGGVRGDAARLPFPSGAFDAVIANHSLEHFVELDAALAEIGRVPQRDGALFVAVPDASTFSDRLYRWLACGGGHVNPFTDAGALAAQIRAATGLPHRGTRILCSSLPSSTGATIPDPPRANLGCLAAAMRACWSG